jgi:hypothetical protein
MVCAHEQKKNAYGNIDDFVLSIRMVTAKGAPSDSCLGSSLLAFSS